MRKISNRLAYACRLNKQHTNKSTTQQRSYATRKQRGLLKKECVTGTTTRNWPNKKVQEMSMNNSIIKIAHQQQVYTIKLDNNQTKNYSAGYRLVKRKIEHSIGIRAEDDSAWERRAPLTPRHVEALLQQGIDVIVQESKTRCFSNEEYREVGAKVVESLSHVDTIFGIKEVPPHMLYPDKTYVFFSHPHKGLKKNKNLMERILEKNVRLIDYERIRNSRGKRLVRFGYYAGVAAAIDTLHLLGERLLVHDKVTTPFINIGYAKNYSSLQNAEEILKLQGEAIKRYGLPAELFPFTITIAGNGTVSKGIREILDLFPVKYVTPDELSELWRKKKYVTRASPETRYLYVCVLQPKDWLRHKVTHKFDRLHYFNNPDEYESTYHRKVLPYTRVLFNAISWSEEYPRLITKADINNIDELPLLVVGDITAEAEGSIEFLKHVSTFEDPYFLYNIGKDKAYSNDIKGDGIVMTSISNWPTAFPKTSSESFGDKLLPYVNSIVKPQEPMPAEVERAVITQNQHFTPQYAHLKKILEEAEADQAHEDPKNVLLLGSGLVTGPIVEYLTRFKFVRLTIASSDEKSAEKLCSDFGRDQATVVRLDAQNHEKLSDLVKDHDIVLSLIPAFMHVPVAKLCIEHKKPMITASYISPEMKDLDEEAKDAGVLLLNEVGVDPGIDHMCVMQTFDEIKEKEGELVSFQSYCGAIPSPEASNNPLGYKFSWSPQGVIAASQNPAHYKEAGQEVFVDGKSLLFNSTPLIKKATFAPGFALEMVPNRDSMKYIDFYGFDKSKIRTMIRGTLRYPGFCNMFRCMKVFGLLDDQTRIDFLGTTREISWRQLLIDLSPFDANIPDNVLIDKLVDYIKERLHEKFMQLGVPQTDAECLAGAREAVTGFIKLGMLDPHEMIEKEENLTIMKAMCNLLTKKLGYSENERDMIFMHHEFIVNYPQLETREKISSSLCVFGDEDPDGFSATAKTVGLPVAITAVLKMRGKLGDLTGVCGPTEKIIYDQTMEALEGENIVVQENIQNLFLDEYFDE